MGHETWVRVERLEKGLCGNSRPVFFRGVATIVTKLFNIVDPDVAVFGKKDYQQWRIIQRMVRDLDFGIKIIGAELVRDDDGLAKSSRNVRLSPQEREKALSISKSLFDAKIAAENGQVVCRELKDSVTRTINEAGGNIDYAEAYRQHGDLRLMKSRETCSNMLLSFLGLLVIYIGFSKVTKRVLGEPTESLRAIRCI